MLLKNAEILNGEFRREVAEIAVRDGVIADIGQKLPPDGEEVDLAGCLIVPGFVDLHIHGCAGYDACDGAPEALAGMAAHLVRQGVTSFCPTTMTLAPERIEAALAVIRACAERMPEGAAICGINLEGPYIAAGKKGAQRAEHVRAPEFTQFQRLYDLSGGLIRLVDIAPECGGAEAFIARAKALCRVSMAHTEAGYEAAQAAFRAGVSHVTHLFNAMTGLGHRAPGAVGAVLDDDAVTAELICDGLHVHPAVLRLAFRLLGEDRTVIISDSMRAAGLSDGEYDLGGQAVRVSGGGARLADGTLAGSTTHIHQEIKNLVSWGVPLRQVIKSATINPARVIGAEQSIGSIERGKRADLVALDEALNVRLVMARGSIAFAPGHI